MQEKLSEIIQEMIEPYQENDEEVVNLLVGVACASWNCEVIPTEESKQYMNSLLEIFDYDDDIKDLMQEFRLYKSLNHPNDQRYIVSHVIYNKDNEYKLRIENMNWSDYEKSRETHSMK